MAAYKKMKDKDLYAILGVKRDADASQIKKEYRKLAKKYHPDSNTGSAGAEQKFKDVTEAYSILSDAEKRKVYDEFGYAAFESGMDPKEYAKRMHEAQKAGFGGFEQFGSGGFGSGGFNGFGTGGFGGFGTGDFGAGSNAKSGYFRNKDGSYTSFRFEGGDGEDYSDLFEQLFKNAGASGRTGGFDGAGFGRASGGSTGFNGAGFGRASGGRTGYEGSGYEGTGYTGKTFYRNGEGTGYGNAADLWEAADSLDAEAPVRITFEEAVLGCDRNIRIPKSDGSGTQTLRVHIPAGIDDGKSVRLRGKGRKSADGSRRGDLLLRVTVEESRDFTRKGLDIYTTASVPFTKAVLGGETEVQMPNGKKILCKIPRGTDAGKKIRIRGKGVHPEKSSARPGDLYVTVQVQIPKDLTDAEVRKLKEFETLYNERHAGRANTA